MKKVAYLSQADKYLTKNRRLFGARVNKIFVRVILIGTAELLLAIDCAACLSRRACAN